MESRFSIINYANAFFGAFFGFWCKILFDPLLVAMKDAWPIVVLVAVICLMAVSLHMSGLWRSRETCFTTPAGEAFGKYRYNWLSLLIFVIAMSVLASVYSNALLFPTVFGGLIYGWWVIGTFAILILTRPEDTL